MNRRKVKRLQLSTATFQVNSGHLRLFIGMVTCYLGNKHKVDAGIGINTIKESGSK
jgi:hypothetical protein